MDDYYEARYDAMSDYNAEQQTEGYQEAVADIIRHIKEHPEESIFTKKEIIEILEGFE